MANCEPRNSIADGLLFRELTEVLIIAEDSDDAKKSKAKPDVSLADGMPLPKYLRNEFPDSLFGKPIHEIDPFYDNKKTFVVISTNWVIHRFSSLKSLWLLTPLNVLRLFCIRTITHWAFRYFMIITVLFYAGFYNKMAHIEWHMPILTIFAVEMNMKIMARGFLMQPFAYLRNPWNWIDFILTQIGSTLGFVAHSLHPIHSLRVLRLIHFFTHSRLSCSWMFRSLRRMKDPFLFGAFMFFLFTVYAQQFLMGILSNRCVQETHVPIKPLVYHNVTYVSPSQLNTNMTELHVVTLSYVCGNHSGSRACPNDSFVCKEGIQNPDLGYTSFDSFPLAAVSIMRLMARDLWDKLYMQIHSAIGAKEFLFILTVIVYGGCYYVNLLLAYIAVGITEMLQILEGKNPKQKRTKAKSRVQSSDGAAASEKEVLVDSNGIEDNDLVQVVDVPLVDVAVENYTKDDEGDSIVQEQPSTSVHIDHTHDGHIEEETGNAYRHRRSPLGMFLMPLVDRFCDWTCCNCWMGFRNKLTTMVQSIYFNIFIGFCIVLNAVTWSVSQHDITGAEYMYIPIIEFAIGWLFLLEAILKILALSPRHYFKDSMNLLDFFIVFNMIFSFAISNAGWRGFTGLGILRMFRVFRLMRTDSWWPYFDNLVKICGTNVWAVLVVVVTFALMGDGIFADDDHSLSWYTLLISVLTNFRVLCGEWIELLWACLLGNSGLYCIPYFFSVILVGNLVLFTLFVTMLAVALNSNNLSETEPVSDRNLISIIKNFLTFSCCSRFRQPKRLEEQARKSQEELVNPSADGEARMPETQPTFGNDVVAPCCCASCYKFLPCCGSASGTSATVNHTPFWRTWTSFRIASLRLINNKYFGYGMNTFIILSCITQAWNDPELDGHFWHMTFSIMNYFVMIIYPLEICLQMSGLGCKKYFTDGWHVFDFKITVLHVLSMVGPLGTYSVFRPPFGFRPLKLIPRLKRLRVVISATFYKLSSLVDVLLACGILWFLFAIFGVAIFGEIFISCKFLQQYDEYEYEDITADYHFKDVGSAFVTLIQLASRKGWIIILRNIFDRECYEEPHQQTEINFSNSIYLFTFFILGVLCCFTFILATFIRKTNVQRKQVGGYIEILMTDEQRQAFARKKNNFFISPVKVSPCPEWWPRRLAYRLVFSSKFKLMVILCTTFNAIGLALISLQASKLMAGAISNIDTFFFLVFQLEVLLRAVAFGRSFFARSWNIYDLVIWVASILLYSLHPFLPGYLPSPMLCSIFRIVRLVRWLKWIRRIGSRLLLHLMALNNVALLLFVIILAYGSVALSMYRHHPTIHPDVGHPDFAYFGSALMSVTMIGFGSSWDVIIEHYEGSRWFILSFLAIFYLVVLQAGAVLFLEHYHLLAEKQRMGLTDDALETFETGWKILDPGATGFIARDHLSEFLNTMLPPLQICHPNQDEMAALDVPINKDDNVAFNDVLLALLARLDDQETDVKTVAQQPVISSTLKGQEEVESTTAEELVE